MDGLTQSLVVRNDSPSLLRRLMGGLFTRGAGSIDSKGPFNTPDAAWSVVMGATPQSYERIGQTVRLKGFEQNAAVNACIRVVADLVAPVRLEMMRESANGDLQPELTNPGQAVLDKPWAPAWSRHRTIQTTIAQIMGYGNSYWVFDRNGVKGGAPQSFRVVHPEKIQFVYLDPKTLQAQRYQWTDLRGGTHISDWSDVIHFRDLTLDPDMLFGFPRGAAALLDMITDGEASEYVRQVVTNSGNAGMIISMEGVTTEDQAKKADERWHEKTIERGGRGRARFMPLVKQIWELGQTLRELEFPDLRAIAREDICAAFGVDPRMIGIASAKGTETGLSGVQYQEARRRLYLQTAAPLMTLIESELDLNYCPEFGDRLRARFSADDLADITEDEEQTSQRVTREWQAGIITLEEARKTRKRPETMPPADHQYLPLGATILPVALQLEGGISAQSDPATDPGQTPPGGASGGAASGNEDAQPTPPAASQKAAPAPIRSRVLIGRNLFRGVALTDEQKRALWQSFDQRATKEETTYRRAAIAQFVVERQGVADIFAQAANRSRRDVPPPADASLPIDPYVDAALRKILESYGEDAAFRAAWLDRYQSLIGETFRVAGADVAASAGLSFDIENVRVQRAIQARARKLADSVTQTTADNITAAVSAGRESGMGIRDIASLVDETCFAGASAVRATRIARTESAGALNQGEFESAQATGVLQSKAWLSQRDGDVRESHVLCDAEGWVGLSGMFANGLQYPGDPAGDAEDVINCRCTLLYSDEDPGATS